MNKWEKLKKWIKKIFPYTKSIFLNKMTELENPKVEVTDSYLRKIRYILTMEELQRHNHYGLHLGCENCSLLKETRKYLGD